MKTKLIFIGIFSFILLTSTLCMAEKAYVTDSFRISFRRGPSIENKILKFIDSGQPVEILENREGWSRIQIMEEEPNNLDGWVLSRYLITRLPWEVQVNNLQAENDIIQKELDTYKEKAQNETAKSINLDEQLKNALKELNRIKNDFATLKQESSEFVLLKTKFEKTKNNEQRLASELKQLEASKRNKWLALGALIMLFGLIIGLQIGKQGKRGRSTFAL
ncbi:MAG: TIGR04211 family SH3 domain-containing protein [Proteobacteria bacterium]|nr:TIGR04211 family SH3 domain-containing protein [Pseudomonadota bacterium]